MRRMRELEFYPVGLLAQAVALALALCSLNIPCQVPDHPTATSTPVNELPQELSDRGVAITHWDLIGPFRFSKTEIDVSNPNHDSGGLNHDYLADFGYSEAQLVADGLIPLCAKVHSCHHFSSDTSVILFDHLFPRVTYAVIYAVAIVDSPTELDAALSLGSSNGVKVRLNGSELFATANDLTRSAFENDDIIPIHLHRGHNFLLVKVDFKRNPGPGDPWALITHILPLSRAHEVLLDNADGHLLSSRLLGGSRQLHLLAHALWSDDDLTIRVNDWRGALQLSRVIRSGESRDIMLPPLEDGYYSLDVDVEGRTLHDTFYVGDYAALNTELVQIQSETAVTSEEHIQREPLLERYKILTSPEYSHPSDLYWQQKMLMVLNEEIRSKYYPHEASWTQMPGAHFREYISKVDNATQPYWLYIPSVHAEKMALVVVMPYAENPVRPFLESALIAWPDALGALERAAGKNMVAVAIINGRGTVGDAPIGEADAFEVMRDITKAYAIDEERIYLYGECEGGRRALLLSEHYPGVFAGVGTYGPSLDTDSRGDKSKFEERSGNVFSLAQNLSSTVVVLVKGEFDEESPTAEIVALQNRLKELSIQSSLDIIPEGLHKRRRPEDTIFPGLVTHSRKSQTNSVEQCFQTAVSKARSDQEVSH